MGRKKYAEEWWAAARALGLTLREDTNGNAMVPLWDTMMSSLRPHARLSEHNWMVGTFDGLPVLVTFYFRDGGSSADTYFTHAMVQIDPPLFLGLHVAQRTWLCGVPRIGMPVFDDKLYVQAFQLERGAAVVWPGRHPPLTDLALSALAQRMTPELYDSFAAITVPRFEGDPAVLGPMLMQAARLARAAVERRATLRDTREEAAMKSAWAHFAERERLDFDPARRALHGAFEGLETHVLTRSTPTAMWNQLLVGLPTDSGMVVDLTPESGLTRFANVIGFSDIEVGDAAFDRAVRLKGAPAPLARAFFAREEARAQAMALVSKYGRLSIHGRFIGIATPRLVLTEAELREAASDVASLARAATGQPPPVQGPYRA